jgi:hypothetical protein
VEITDDGSGTGEGATRPSAVAFDPEADAEAEPAAVADTVTEPFPALGSVVGGIKTMNADE